MRRHRPQRIGARQADAGGNARQGGGVHLHPADDVPRHPVQHRHRQQRRPPLCLPDDIVDGFGVQRHNARQPFEGLAHVARILAQQGDAIVLFVVGQHLTLAVENQTAVGRQQFELDPVLFGQQAKGIRLVDLHLVHPPPQNTHDTQLHRPHQDGAAADPAGLFGSVVLRTSHGAFSGVVQLRF